MDLTAAGYHKVKSSQVTQQLNVDICYQCYFDLSKYRSASGEPLHAYLSILKKSVKGSRPLYPAIGVANVIHRVGCDQRENDREERSSIQERDFL